ncbi:MAG: ABC transporter permease [Erysipelotrichaceae bacterium]
MILEYIQIAFRSILANKARSLLTMLGVIIGVASVVMLTSLGSSARVEAEKQIRSIGSNTVFVFYADPNGYVPTNWLNSIQEEARIKQYSPIVEGTTTYMVEGKPFTVIVQGVNSYYGDISSFTYRSGGFFSGVQVENNLPVVVIGSDVADQLFGFENPIGKTLTIQGLQFSVVGVVNPRGTNFGGNNDVMVYIPLSQAQALYQTNGLQRRYYISAWNEADIDITQATITRYLSARLPSSNNFGVFSQTQVLDLLGTILALLTTLLAGIAAISLVVGGIGIMNIMLVTVRERTREIGIRKALGARQSYILLQFLIEAVMITFLGGLLGLGISYAGALLISQLSGFTIQIGASAIFFALFFSITIGVAFGLYPAYKASNLEPVEALRYE